MIVTNRGPRKHPAKPAQEPLIKARVVQTTPKGKAWKVPAEPDPEADVRVAAFFARMIKPRT